MNNRDNLAATTVPNAATDMLTIKTGGCRKLFVVLTASVAALTAFAIKVTAKQAGTAVTLFNDPAQFVNPVRPLLGCSGDLTNLAVGTGWFILECDGFEEVTINATSGGTAKLAIEASAF